MSDTLDLIKKDLHVVVREELINNKLTHKVDARTASIVGQILLNIFIETVNDELESGNHHPLKVAQEAINKTWAVVDAWGDLGSDSLLHMGWVESPSGIRRYDRGRLGDRLFDDKLTLAIAVERVPPKSRKKR